MPLDTLVRARAGEHAASGDGKVRLHLGCGNDILAGWVHLDHAPPEVVAQPDEWSGAEGPDHILTGEGDDGEGHVSPVSWRRLRRRCLKSSARGSP